MEPNTRKMKKNQTLKTNEDNVVVNKLDSIIELLQELIHKVNTEKKITSEQLFPPDKR